MASITDYEAYHNFILGSCGAITANAKTLLLVGNDVIGDDGQPLTKVTLEHITQSTFTEQKDSLLYDCLRFIEKFEQAAESLGDVADITPIREIEDAPAAPTPTPTPSS